MQQRDAWRLAAIFLCALLVGTLLGATRWCLLLAAVGYIIWLHIKLERLLSWLRDHKTHEPPEAPGAFEELSLEIDYLRERHKKRKKKLANYLKQFQQATRALPDATVVLDARSEVRWANAAAPRPTALPSPRSIPPRPAPVRVPGFPLCLRPSMDASRSIPIHRRPIL